MFRNMKTTLYISVLFVFVLIFNMACKSKKNIAEENNIIEIKDEAVSGISKTTASALVYKTRKDYSQFVPVIMNDAKTEIISYPDPTDVYYKGALAFPTVLAKGYLLDNRGISPNVAFLNYTYQEYSKLKGSPAMGTLINKIMDKNPLLELWNCGLRTNFKNEVEEINVLINNNFADCKQVFVEPITNDLPKD